MSHIFQISLKSVLLLENGEKIYPNGKTVLSVSLVYPREGVKTIEFVKTLPLNGDDDENTMPLKAKEEYSLSLEPFEQKLLFKESIQGDSIIRINLGISKSVSKLNEFLKKLIKAGAVAAFGEITGGIGIAVTVGMAEAAVESFFDAAKDEEKIYPLGTASFGINNNFNESEMIFHLVTKKEIKYVADRKQTEEGQIVETRVTIPKGYGIGRVILNIEKKQKEAVPVIA